MPRVENQNVDSNNLLHEDIRLHYTQINLESTQILRYQTRPHQPLEKDLQRPESICTDRRREQHVRDQEKTKLLFNTVLQNSLKDDIQRWQKKKGMGMYLSDNDRDCLTNLRVADVLLFAFSKEKFQKNVVRIQEKYWKSGSQDPPRKDENSQQPKQPELGHKKEMEVDDIKIEILTRGESVRYLGQTITFLQQETTEIKKRIRAAWATFHRQELTSKNYMLKHRFRLFDAAITPTICYASGTWEPTKEHERMIQSTQRKMLRHIIETKRRYKKNHETQTQDQRRNGQQ